MNVVLAFHSGDARSAIDLLRWIGELGGAQNYRMCLVMDEGVSWIDGQNASTLARKAFRSVEMHTTGGSVAGWIPGSNSLWLKAAKVMMETAQPWLFIEPDVVPLKADWLQRLESAYESSGKRYLGAVIEHQTKGFPNPYMEGIAVYPPDAFKELSPLIGLEKSWTHTTATVVIPQACNTPLIHHLWGEVNNPPTFSTRAVPRTNVFCPEQIRPEAVLFHRSKDGTLIRLLRHRKRGVQVVSSAKLDLKRVTLWSCVWSHDPELLNRTMRVLYHCMKHCEFGEVILFTSEVQDCEPSWRVVQISPLDMAGWNKFLTFDLPNHIKTDFALSVHEDGFIIDPSLWTQEFLNYDYIGAPWSDHVVGNGGFFLQSRKMLTAQVHLPPNFQNQNADMYVCRTHRATLEQKGVRFAPEHLALRFSTETIGNDRASFGFHGRNYSPQKYRFGWQQIEKRQSLVLTYIHVVGNPKYQQYLERFLKSYQANPPGCAHDTVIVLNGGTATEEIVRQFSILPNCTFLEHDNSGYDIGGFQNAALLFPADIMVFFGASTFFTKPGWLARIVEATRKHGDAIYGAMGNRGAISIGVYPHLRTTAFWMNTDLMLDYPVKVVNNAQRHPFEHGPNNITAWAMKQGLKAWVVTWSGEYEWAHWDDDPQGYNRGNQKSLLAGDHLCEPPHFDPSKKR